MSMYIYIYVSASGFPFLNENWIWILGLTDWNCVKLPGNRVLNIDPSSIPCLKELFSHRFGHRNSSNNLEGAILQALRWLLDHINLTWFMKASFWSLIPWHKVKVRLSSWVEKCIHSPCEQQRLGKGAIVWHKAHGCDGYPGTQSQASRDMDPSPSGL